MKTRADIPSVEVFVSDECPNAASAVERVEEAAASIGMTSVEARIVRVGGIEDALARRFLGSPSVRINGRDVEPGADSRRDFGLQCRLYEFDGGLHGLPPVALIAHAPSTSARMTTAREPAYGGLPGVL